MSTQPIARPGQTVDKSLAQLLNFDDSADIVIKWEERMRDIDEAGRSAENEEASVRIY